MSEAAGIPGVGEGQPGGTPAGTPAGGNEPSAFSTLVGGLDPQLAQNPNLTKHSNMESLAKEYVNLVSVVGRQGVKLPNPEDPGDRERFYKELGRPDTPGSYDFGDWKPPEGMPWDDQVGAAMVAKLWERGCTQDMVPGIVQDFAEMQQAQWTERQQNAARVNQETISTLQQELGQAYGQRMNLCHRAVQHLFPDTDPEEILNTRLENGVALGDFMPFVRAMMKASDGLKEDDFIEDRTKGIPGAKTPSEAKDELDALMADKEFRAAYFDGSHPNHKAVLAKADELYAYMGESGGTVKIGIGGIPTVSVTPGQGDPNA